MNASRPELSADEPVAPPSLGTVAAALATCTHPEGTEVAITIDLEGGAVAARWCAACGALRPEGGAAAAWRCPELTSRLTKPHFEQVVLLLHGVVQVAQLARAHVLPGAASAAHAVLRNLRASLAELSRLSIVRDVDRLEQAIAPLSSSPVRP
jgi:hypothetical protein